MTTRDDTTIARARFRWEYDERCLKEFSSRATAVLVAGLALAAATAGLAIGYGYRIIVIHDLMAHRGKLSGLRSADTFVKWMLYSSMVIWVAWAVALVRWVKGSIELVGISEPDAATRRRRFKQVLEREPDWKAFRLWERSLWAYAVAWLLRFVIPTTTGGALVHLEGLVRRALIVNVVSFVLLVIITTLGWRAKKAVECGSGALTVVDTRARLR